MLPIGENFHLFGFNATFFKMCIRSDSINKCGSEQISSSLGSLLIWSTLAVTSRSTLAFGHIFLFCFFSSQKTVSFSINKSRRRWDEGVSPATEKPDELCCVSPSCHFTSSVPAVRRPEGRRPRSRVTPPAPCDTKLPFLLHVRQLLPAVP